MTTGPENVSRPNIAGPVGDEQRKPSMGPQTDFQSYMKGGAGEPNPLTQPKTAQVSPFDLAHGQVPADPCRGRRSVPGVPVASFGSAPGSQALAPGSPPA
jgi:hypothetical protein